MNHVLMSLVLLCASAIPLKGWCDYNTAYDSAMAVQVNSYNCLVGVQGAMSQASQAFVNTYVLYVNASPTQPNYTDCGIALAYASIDFYDAQAWYDTSVDYYNAGLMFMSAGLSYLEPPYWPDYESAEQCFEQAIFAFQQSIYCIYDPENDEPDWSDEAASAGLQLGYAIGIQTTWTW